MSGNPPLTPQGNVPRIVPPDVQDYPRLVFSAPYFEQIAIAEIIQPSVTEAVEAALPALVPQYVDAAAQAAVSQLAVLLTGSTMTGSLFLSPLMPTQPSQAATMAYVDAMIATAGIPEVPPVPSGQVWAREVGQWVPITPQTGVFLPLSGGTMVGNIAMSGNTINGLAAVPSLPNGAAPAQWVLNQIASVSLFQGQWDADTNVPDLTQLSVRVNGYTWIAITTSVSGVVVGQAIPGLQGTTVFNGDTIYYSTVDGEFFAIHAGGLTLPEADARYVQLAGSQMSGPLLLNANASQPLQAVTLQQLQAFVPPGAVGEAPNDGQLYGRNGLTASWAPVLPLAGGIMTGMITLSGNATQPLQPATLGQMNSTISSAVAGYLPLGGNASMTGLFTLSGNATASLNPVPLQQLNSMLGAYATLSGATFTGPVTLPTGSTVAGYLPLTGGTLTGALTVNASAGLTVINGAINFGVGPTYFANISSPSSGILNISGPGGAALATIGLQAGTVSLSGSLNAANELLCTGNVLLVNNTLTGTLDGWRYGGVGGVNAMAFIWSGGNPFLFVDGTNSGFWSLTAASDDRVKTVQGNYTKSLAAIMQLQPITFTYRGNDAIVEPASGESAPYRSSPQYNQATNDTLCCGLSAQSVQAVFPECVSESAAWIDGTAVSDLRRIDTSPLLYAMINAIIELGGRVQALDNKDAT